MDSLLYPSLSISEDETVFSNLYLPEDYKIRVPIFYKCNGRDLIENYASCIARLCKTDNLESNIKLNWDDKIGLKNIILGSGAGLDLTDIGFPRFVDHNIGFYNVVPGLFIGMEYIKELYNLGSN